jgi:hypothetical protein
MYNSAVTLLGLALSTQERFHRFRNARCVSRNRNGTALRPLRDCFTILVGTVKSVFVLLLEWLSPTPKIAISEIPTDESLGPMEAQLQWIRVPGVWKV